MCANMHSQTHMLYCTHTHVGLLWAKSTYGPIIWSLKVFGFIFNSAGEQVCQLLDCLNHIIPPLCILMNVHQAKRCVCGACGEGTSVLYALECVCARLVSGVRAFPSVSEYLDAYRCVSWHALNLHYV